MRQLKERLLGIIAAAALLAMGITLRAGRSPLLPIDPAVPVSVRYNADSMPEPAQLSPEDAGKVMEIPTRNKSTCRYGTSDCIGIFILCVGDQSFSCCADGSDLNDAANNLNLQIKKGREDPLRILLKYTEGYRQPGQHLP